MEKTATEARELELYMIISKMMIYKARLREDNVIITYLPDKEVLIVCERLAIEILCLAEVFTFR